MPLEVGNYYLILFKMHKTVANKEFLKVKMPFPSFEMWSNKNKK